MVVHDKETDFCMNCGHQLGEHRQSGRCTFVVHKKPEDLGEFCKCDQFIIRADTLEEAREYERKLEENIQKAMDFIKEKYGS